MTIHSIPPFDHHGNRRWPAFVLTMGLAACGGGGSDDEPPVDGGDSTVSRLFVGYYAEDAADNPEDPTIGALLFRVPDTDGDFAGQMPFSYAGCAGGIDTGIIGGRRTGESLDGQWSGTMDGTVAIGGGFSGRYESATGGFSGTYTNDGGKVQVLDFAPCQYTIASHGRFQVWPETTSQPSAFVLSVDDRNPPGFSWTPLDAGTRYTLRLFDWACLQADASDPACFVAESPTLTSASVTAALPLTVGAEHLAVLTAQTPADEFAGFASLRFTPGPAAGSEEPAPDPEPDPDPEPEPETGWGTLTLTGASMGAVFDPGASPQGGVDIAETGPNCNATTGNCTSILSITWTEQDVLASSMRSVGVMLISNTSGGASGNPPGVGVTDVTVVYNQILPSASAATYTRTCGSVLYFECSDRERLGVWNAEERSFTFDDVQLPGQAPTTGAVTLQGRLHY